MTGKDECMAEDSGDLVGAGQKILDLVHDLANHLNHIVLQASCVLLKADENIKAEIEVIRQEGIQAAALVRTLQQIGQEIQSH
jgi:hypothetical protein